MIRDDDAERQDYTDEPDYSRQATRREVAELRTLVRALEMRLDRETTVVAALCEVVADVLSQDRRTLLDRVREAVANHPDVRAKKCPRCHQPVPARSPRCIYCGADRVIESVTDLLYVAPPPAKAER